VNGNIWFIKNNKWNEIKDTIKNNIIGDNKINEYEILTIN
jgi:hypothetical protein